MHVEYNLLCKCQVEFLTSKKDKYVSKSGNHSAKARQDLGRDDCEFELQLKL